MSEHTEQSPLEEWAAWNQGKDAALNMLYAVPNGGKRECDCPVMDAADCLTLRLQLPRNYYRDLGIDAVCDCDCHGNNDDWDDDDDRDEFPF